MNHSRSVMCKSICSPAAPPLQDCQLDDKSELRLEDIKISVGSGFLVLTIAVKIR